MQRVVGLGIGGEPVLAVDLLAPGGELRKQVLLALLLANVGNRFAERLDDLEVVIVHPDPSLEVALVLLNQLGRDIENVGV